MVNVKNASDESPNELYNIKINIADYNNYNHISNKHCQSLQSSFILVWDVLAINTNLHQLKNDNNIFSSTNLKFIMLNLSKVNRKLDFEPFGNIFVM